MTKTKKQHLIADAACYLTEDSLVQDLKSIVEAPRNSFRCRSITVEFDFTSGRTDVLGLDSKRYLHAFEAKLTKWRKALEQAGRNTSFAHYAYVVLPARAAGPALRAEAEFTRRGVGLLVLGGKSPHLAIKPRRGEPLLPWLTNVAMKCFASGQ